MCGNITRVGKILFGIPLIMFGAMHVMYAPGMAMAVPAWLPGGIIWVYLTGAVFVASALTIMTGIKAKWGAVALSVMIALFIVLIHVPGLADPMRMNSALTNLLKDLVIMAGALLIAGMHWKDEGGCCGAGGAACGCSEEVIADEVPEEGCCGGGCCDRE